MRYYIENERLQLAVDTHGGEIKSLYNKEQDLEYMWCGDPQYWGRTAPVLFPFVGSVKDKEFRAKGRTYTMGQHGFARDMEFVLVEQTQDRLVMQLSSDEETMKRYPYAFVLRITYILTETSVETIWQVTNPSKEETLPFSIGGHPAFNCPAREGERQSDYRFYLETDAPIVSRRIEQGLATDVMDTYELDHRYLKIDEHLFDHDALVIEHQDVKKVSLINPQGEVHLTVRMEVPLFGLWSPVGKHAPFVCIEPWYGRCDHQDFTGDVTERAFGNSLMPGASWQGGYTLEV